MSFNFQLHVKEWANTFGKGLVFMMEKRSKIFLNRRSVLKIGVLSAATLVVGVSPFKKLRVEEVQAADKESGSKQLGFFHNQNRCIGCRSCEYACKKLYNWEEGVRWRKVLSQKKGEPPFLSMSCNHCADPACVKVCPVGAYQKREKDGIVIHNSSKCVGCGYCLYACPYHAPQMGEESGAVSKCSFCYERIDKGERPACVAACPVSVSALQYGDLSVLKQQDGAVNQISGLPSPELTQPSFVIIPRKEK